jgi:hypothetical protein
MGKETEVNEYELQRAANIEANGSHRANKKHKVNVFPYLISSCFLQLI